MPPGEYFVSFSKPGFAAGMYGEKEKAGYGELVAVQSGRTTGGLVAKLWKRPTISGSVLDASGAPISGAKLELLFARWMAGQLVYGSLSTAKSDENGEFRFSTPAGKYLVFGPILPPSAPIDVVPFLFPQALSISQAEPISVDYGEERNGLFVPAALASKTYAVTGVVISREPDHRQIQLSLRIRRSFGAIADVEVARATPSIGGQFEFRSIPPGEYELRAVSFPAYPDPTPGTPRLNQGFQGSSGSPIGDWSDRPLAPLPDGKTLWIEEPVDVIDRDVRLPTQLLEGLVVQGNIVFSGDNPPNSEELLTRCVSLVPADGRNLGLYPCGRIERDGSFRTIGVPAGRYVLEVPRGFGEWQLASAKSGTSEIAGRSFEVSSSVSGLRLAFSRKRTTVSGAVVDKDGRPAPSAAVLILDSDYSGSRADGLGVRSRMLVSRTDSAGKFEAEVYPGTYALVAFDAAAPVDWQAPSSVEALVRTGKRVAIAIGRNDALELRLVKK